MAAAGWMAAGAAGPRPIRVPVTATAYCLSHLGGVALSG